MGLPIFTKVIAPSLNPSVSTTAYTAGDVVGGLLEFPTRGLSNNVALLNGVRLVDAANQSEPYKLYLFSAAPTTIANDAAFAPVAADLNKCQTIVTIVAGDYTQVNSLGIAFVHDLNDVLYSANGIIYGYLVATDTPDYAAATDVTITLLLMGD